MKITYSSENINSFGGINFADHIVNSASVYKTIDQTLGQRGIKAEYSYGDLFRSYLLMVLCGGVCAEDITEHLRAELALSLIHISEPTRLGMISYAVFCLKKKKTK